MRLSVVLLAALVICGPAWSQASFPITGKDYSVNAPALPANLLATIPAAKSRQGYFIQAQCAAGLVVVYDAAPGDGNAATQVLVPGGASNGIAGSSVDMEGMPHTGRIRIYSSNATCQLAARAQ